MTVDDENSVYVGNLPYDATEDSTQSVFDLYAQIIAFKINLVCEFATLFSLWFYVFAFFQIICHLNILYIPSIEKKKMNCIVWT